MKAIKRFYKNLAKTLQKPCKNQSQKAVGRKGAKSGPKGTKPVATDYKQEFGALGALPVDGASTMAYRKVIPEQHKKQHHGRHDMGDTTNIRAAPPVWKTAQLAAAIRGHTERLYGAAIGGRTAQRILDLLESHAPLEARKRQGWDERDVWLITYGDSICPAGASGASTPRDSVKRTGPWPLETLRAFLGRRVGDLVSFLHILPFFPSSSDDGFAVTDFRRVDPALGTWAHLQALGKDYRLVFDAVINHVSAASGYMRGFMAGDPRYEDFFINVDPDADLSAVVRPRALPLCHRYETARGPQWLWTTFSRDQVDLNYRNPDVLLEVIDVLLFYVKQGASALRLDAIAYLWKEMHTSCIHLENTHEVIKLLRTLFRAACPGVLILTETNVPHKENIAYFGDTTDEAHMVYNFPLAPLIVHTLQSADASVLTRWAAGLQDEGCGFQNTFLNFTATHDGIGVRPTEGLLSAAERTALVENTLARGGRVSYKQNPDGSKTPYELNISYFDAVNDPRAAESQALQVDRFMVSQAIVLSLAGIPAIYIHSLLGSRNDLVGLKKSGRARSINRAKLDLSTLEAALDDPHSLRCAVFERYTHLLDVRRREAAFHPASAQQILDLNPAVFALRRHHAEKDETVVALHNVSGRRLTCILPSALARLGPFVDLLSSANGPVYTTPTVALAPYGVCWLKPLA